MSIIRDYVTNNLLPPMQLYPTSLQDTIVEIIIQRLEELYAYTLKFPEIVSPDQDRLDIVKVIADQFSFSIRDDAELQEQLDILENILYVYRKRGSIDTIEHMWKYYGGNLPKEVSVVLPSNNVFRYSISSLSSKYSFMDGGVSSIILDTKSPEDIFNSTLHNITKDLTISISGVVANSDFVLLNDVDDIDIGDIVSINDVYEGTVIDIARNNNSNINRAGVYEIRLSNSNYPIADLRQFLLSELVAAGNLIYFTNAISVGLTDDYTSEHYRYLVDTAMSLVISDYVYCTTYSNNLEFETHLYNENDEPILDYESFILGRSLLGEFYNTRRMIIGEIEEDIIEF